MGYVGDAMSGVVGIVVGGASSVWDEVNVAQRLVSQVGVDCKYFVCNDMIEAFSKECVCCTLHADKLPMWLSNRTAKGMQTPRDIWVCTQEKDKAASQVFATHSTNDWGGSCGLFATKIAIQEYKLPRVILCGVPLTITGGHFVRNQPWQDQITFETRWRPHFKFLQQHARSLSGLTRQWLGEPDIPFITGGKP